MSDSPHQQAIHTWKLQRHRELLRTVNDPSSLVVSACFNLNQFHELSASILAASDASDEAELLKHTLRACTRMKMHLHAAAHALVDLEVANTPPKDLFDTIGRENLHGPS